MVPKPSTIAPGSPVASNPGQSKAPASATTSPAPPDIAGDQPSPKRAAPATRNGAAATTYPNASIIVEYFLTDGWRGCKREVHDGRSDTRRAVGGANEGSPGGAGVDAGRS